MVSGNDFKASFGALKISFMSSEKAIIWVQLDEGTLKPPKGTKSFEFYNWSIAFEVKIRIMTHEEVLSSSKSWFIRFIESFAWKKHGNHEYRTLVHLALDLNSSEFAYELSKFEGLPLGNRSAVEGVKGIVHYLKQHYLPTLIQHGYHILQSIPLWKTGSFPPPLGLTDVTFQTYSKDSVDRQNCQQMSQNQEIVLVLLGMTNFHHRPPTRLQYSTQWFVQSKKSISHGAVCLSRKTFLEERLFAHLKQLNDATTIVPTPHRGKASNGSIPIFNGHQGDALGLALNTWANDDHRWGRSDRCQWEPNGGNGNSYIWSHIGRWNHEHWGSIDDQQNGAYMVSCQTKNSLDLPSSPNSDSLDITIRGEINIGLSFQNDSSTWGSKAIGKWETTLSMKTKPDGSGIAIETSGSTQPEFEIIRIQGEANLKDLIDLDALRSLVKIDMVGVVGEMKQTFGGVWEHCFPGMRAYSLCSPAFNARGDILFELHPYAGSNHPPIRIMQSRKFGESEAPSTSIHKSTSRHSLTSRKSGSCMLLS
ncbi:hypothetical protein BD779DRAFT_202385 [Infundibulicybe gibba]|nr:hypothetical protein BD779DRAFT_202385 [Infundibulicybe gibba]